MKKTIITKTLVAMSLLLSANFVIASDITVTVPDVKGAAKSTAGAVKEDVKTSADTIKTGAKNTVDNTRAKAKASKKKAETTLLEKSVDINNATKTELKTIPGIGDAYSSKIIAGRPYTDISDLKTRKVIPTAVYEKIKDVVTVN